MPIQRDFQPRQGSFLFQRIGPVAVVAIILSIAVVLGALLLEEPLLAAALPALWILLLPLTIWGAFVAYGKERYELHSDHLVCRHGGLLSDGRTELDIRNITHVRLRLPWIRHRLFGIGDVRVESAGSAGSEITFHSVVDPEPLFEEIQQIMRTRGYALQGGETLYEESPGVVGALTEVVRLTVVMGVTLFTFGSFLASAAMEVSSGSTAQTIGAGLMALVGGAVALAGLGGVGIRYLDLRRRTYTVREDMVVYTEGFLTRDNAIIPFENLADAGTTRSFWDQLLGLYDVRVSCQGAGSEIVFRRLSQGEQLKSAITRLVSSAGSRKHAVQMRPDPAPSAVSPSSVTAAPTSPQRAGRRLVAPDETWTATLKMHLPRAVLKLTPALVVPPAWLAAVIMTAIRASRTEYHVEADTLSESYSFIGSSQTQFAYDKVTGVQLTTTPLDSLFGTVSVEVWSIGAPKPIQMLHIPSKKLNLQALLRQCGIPAGDAPAQVLSQSYGPKAAVISQAPSLVFISLCLVGLLVASLVAGPLALLAVPPLLALPLMRVAWTALRIRRQTFSLFREHFEAQTGIWFRKHVFVRYSDVKKIESVQIPLTRQGRLALYVAGEKVLQTKDGETRIPNVVQVAFLEDMDRLVDALDEFMLGRIDATVIPTYDAPAHAPLSVSKPSKRSAGLPLLLFGLLFPPLWLVLPLVLWQTHVRRFIVEEHRVLKQDGIFFQRVTSIPFHKLDSIQQVQGAMGKAFGNGKITLLTAGSSKPDLILAHIPDHGAVYELIRAHYRPDATT